MTNVMITIMFVAIVTVLVLLPLGMFHYYKFYAGKRYVHPVSRRKYRTAVNIEERIEQLRQFEAMRNYK